MPPAVGQLDATFGVGGGAAWPLPNRDDYARALGQQSTGKLVAVGHSGGYAGTAGTFAVARYDSGGALDMTFGNPPTTPGVAYTDFPFPNGSDDVVAATAIQPDDKIIAAGYTWPVGGTASYHQFGLVRYMEDGLLDTTFGSSGFVVTGFPGEAAANAVAIDSTGRIVATGKLRAGGYLIAVARYTSAGTLDTTFGSGGQVATATPNMDCWANAVVVDTNDRVVIAGVAEDLNRGGFRLARYTQSGQLDPAFGSGGIVTTYFGKSHRFAEARALICEPGTQSLVAAGSVSDPRGARRMAFARYHENGSLDTSFGTGGKVVVNTLEADAYGLALQRDGKLVVSGQLGYWRPFNPFLPVPPPAATIIFGRLTANGQPDPAFAGGGSWFAYPAGVSDAGRGVLLQPNGRIVAAGPIDLGGWGGWTFLLVRLQ